MPQLQHEFCTLEGCGRPHKARGYCQTHYTQLKRGVPLTPVIAVRVRNRDPICTIEGCSNPEKALGLCAMHHQRMQRHGSTEFRPRWKEQKRGCEYPNCNGITYANGLCQSHYTLDRKWAPFGVTALRYAEMFEEQEGLCALCRCPEETFSGKGEVKRLAVDHCHETNRIRGLLCANCNRALGLFKDDPTLLRKAADYLCEPLDDLL